MKFIHLKFCFSASFHLCFKSSPFYPKVILQLLHKGLSDPLCKPQTSSNITKGAGEWPLRLINSRNREGGL